MTSHDDIMPGTLYLVPNYRSTVHLQQTTSYRSTGTPVLVSRTVVGRIARTRCKYFHTVCHTYTGVASTTVLVLEYGDRVSSMLIYTDYGWLHAKKNLCVEDRK
jgi:hypothetical protein